MFLRLVVCTYALRCGISTENKRRRAKVVASGARALMQSELELLHDQRFVVIPKWLSDAEIDDLQADAIAVDRGGSSFDCCVGSGAKLDVRQLVSIHRVLACLACPC